MRLVRPTRPHSTPPAYLFTLGRLTNNAALILPPEADLRQSEISPLPTSETFTQRTLHRIGAGSPHANSSVNGANAFIQPPCSSESLSNLQVRNQLRKMKMKVKKATGPDGVNSKLLKSCADYLGRIVSTSSTSA